MTITRGNNYKRKEGGWKPRAFSGRIITEERIDIIAAGGWSKGEGKRKRWRREGKG